MAWLLHANSARGYLFRRARRKHSQGQIWNEYHFGPIRDKSGVCVGVTVVAHDVTERKNAEKILRYHYSLVQNISDATISTDLEFNLRSWNEAAEILYGWRADEVHGYPLEDFVKTEYLHETRDQVIETFYEAGNWKGEVAQHQKDGTPIRILASVAILKDSGETGRNCSV